MIEAIPGVLGGSALASVASGIKLDDIIQIGIRVALIGLLTAFVRSGFTRLRVVLYTYLFPTAHISKNDPAYEWIESYLAQSAEVQAQLNSFKLTTADARQSKRDDANRLRTNTRKANNLSLGRMDATFVGDVVGQMTPIDGRTITLHHNGNRLWITRKRIGFATMDPDDKDKEAYFLIGGVSWQPDSIKEFLLDSHARFFKRAEDELIIFNVSPYSGGWGDPIHRPSRSWSSVILPNSLKNPLLEDVKNFLSDEEKVWYGKRGIPHRRGYLLHGRPGSGKTTLATAIASQLGLDIYIVNPAARGMDDGKLNKAFRNCPPQNMILIEDIDCVMPPRPRRKGASEDDSDDEDDSAYGDTGKDAADPGKYGLAKSTVTLSGLLNAIDGVSSQEDCILFATTNHPERLDSALSRPGRFDVQLSFSDATYTQAVDLYKHFFPLSEFGPDAPANASVKSATASDIKEVDEKAAPQEAPLRGEDDLDRRAKDFADGVFNVSPPVPSTPGGGIEVNQMQKQHHEMEYEQGISMAALQGYLLMHKNDPVAAAQNAGGWSAELSRAHQEKEAGKRERKAKREQAQGQGKTRPVTPATPSTVVAQTEDDNGKDQKA